MQQQYLQTVFKPYTNTIILYWVLPFLSSVTYLI
jgi:hypothetical protein